MAGKSNNPYQVKKDGHKIILLLPVIPPYSPKTAA